MAQLAWLTTVQWDYHTARVAARRFEAGRLSGRWQLEELAVGELIAIFDVLRAFEPPPQLEELALAILAHSRRMEREVQTPEARRDFSGSLDRVGDFMAESGKLREAETLYGEGLELRRTLAGELQTPEAMRELALSLDRVGDVMREWGELDQAATLYREGLELRRRLAGELQTPMARRDFSGSLHRVGGWLRLRANSPRRRSSTVRGWMLHASSPLNSRRRK